MNFGRGRAVTRSGDGAFARARDIVYMAVLVQRPPVLHLERFAAIAAEIDVEGPAVDVLAREAITPDEWRAAQEYWMTRIAERARGGRLTLARRYAELFSTHRARCEERRRGSGAAASPGAGPTAPPATPAAAVHEARRPSLTLQQFAALRAELTSAPDDVRRVCARFGLDEGAWEKEEEYWRHRLADAGQFAAYLLEYRRFRALLASGGRPGEGPR